MPGSIFRTVLLLILPAAGFQVQLARAQVVPDQVSPEGNEIIVTAEKRAAKLGEVPASISLVSAERAERAHARDLIDLQTLVPSLRVRQFQNSAQANFQIRGIGNDANNIGIETAVGLFIDGVYHSRAASALADLPDIDRVEVLRGPQSTLFGKNVSAGAILVVTQRPLLGQIAASAEATIGNFAALEGRAMLNLPLGSNLAVKLTGSIRTRDGYFRNPVAGGRVNNRDRYALRGDALFEPGAGMRFRLLVDHGRIDELCCGVAALAQGPVTTGIIAGRLGAAIGNPGAIYDYTLATDRNPHNRLVNDGVSFTGEIDLGFADLTTISAFRRQSNYYSLDADFTGAPIVSQAFSNNIKTWSQELRLASRGDGPLTWVAGAFVLDEKLRSRGNSLWGRDGRSFIDSLTGKNVTNLEGVLIATRTPGIGPGTLVGAGQGLAEDYRMDDRSFSLFANADYRIAALTLSGGLAYVDDRKRARSNVVSNDVFALLNLQNLPQLALAGLPANAFGALGAVQFFPAPVNFPNASENGVLEGNRITYALRASYRLSKALMVYATHSIGWKAGVFNLSRDSRPPDSARVGRTAGPERISLYEAGLKASFARGFANLSVFDQAVRGFQSNSFTGTGFALVNAGKQSVRGVELEAGYRPLDGLSFDLAVTHLDARFDSFALAPCVQADPVRCGAGQLYRDLSGTRPADTPAWTVNLGASYDFALGDDWQGTIHADYFHTSSIFQALTVPAAIATTRARTLNLSASVGRTDRIEIQLWARNVTKDRYTRNAFPAVAQAGSYVAFPVEPQLFGATVRRSF